jgi:hypothetical protein
MKQPYLMLPDVDSQSMGIVHNGVTITHHTNGYITIEKDKDKDDGWITLPILSEWGNLELSELKDYELEFEADIKDNTKLYLLIESQQYKKETEKETIDIQLDENFRISFEVLGITDYRLQKLSIVGKFGSGITIKRLAFVHKDYQVPSTIKRRFHFIPKANWRGREKSLQDMFEFNPPDILPSDMILVRPKTQDYTEQEIKDFDKDLMKYKDCRIINQPSQIVNGHFKDRTMKIWDENNITVPKWRLITDKQDIIDFIDEHSFEHVLIKVIDGHSGKMQRVVTREQIYNDKKKYNECNQIVMEIVKTDKDYDLVGKAYVTKGKVHDVHGYLHLRDKKDNIAKNPNSEYNLFLLGLKVILKASKQFEDEISKAVSCVCDTASVDYIIGKDRLYFLEVNPYWGTGNAWGTTWPNNKKFTEQLNKETDEEVLPLKNRMDEYTLWEKYYNRLS